MASKQTFNFDLRVQSGPDGYRLLAMSQCSGGEAKGSLLPLEPNLFQSLHTPQAIRQIGKRLFEAVFQGEILVLWHQSLDTARQQNTRLRLRLMLTDVPKLANLPWECLCDPVFNQFLALSVETPIVRYLDLPSPPRPMQTSHPLHILVLAANPKGDLDAEGEWLRLHQALHEVIESGQATIERLEKPTWSALQRRLRQGEIHILHFIGHGGFDESVGEGSLLFEDESRKGNPVSASRLGTLLHDHQPLRLVLLNACRSGETSPEEPFAGVAQTLIQNGIPAVIAMQRPISDQAAVTLAKEFYAALADLGLVDAGLAEARKAIFISGNESEWIIPALYTRSPDGQLFSPQRSPINIESKQENRLGLSANAEIKAIREHLQRQRLVLFLGADLPENITGLPPRRSLAEQLASQEGIPGGQRLAAVAQQVMIHGNRWLFTDFLRQALDTIGKRPLEYHKAIANLIQAFRIETILTTAYDDLIEQACREAGITLNLVINDTEIAFIRPDRPSLFRLYGDLRQAESLVVTEQDENALLRGRIKPDIVEEVRRAFRRNSVLFIGYDLSDPSISAWFDEVAGDRFQIASYAVWPGLNPHQRQAFQANRGLHILEMDPLDLLRALHSSR